MKGIKIRNFWPQGTRGGVTRVVPNKKGKGSYKRRDKHKRAVVERDGCPYFLFCYWANLIVYIYSKVQTENFESNETIIW